MLDGPEDSLFDDRLDHRLYPELPAEVEEALRNASLAFGDGKRAERYLEIARRLCPDHRAVLIAHYRYHFYKHDLVQAAVYARRCLANVAEALGLPVDVLEVEAAHADFSSDTPDVRFWMFAMQAYGYVLLRLGEREKAVEVLEKVCSLDVRNQTKTKELLEVVLAPRDD